MALRRGSAVWVEDKECAWAEAEVVDPKEKLVVVVTPQGKKVAILFRFFFLSFFLSFDLILGFVVVCDEFA